MTRKWRRCQFSCTKELWPGMSPSAIEIPTRCLILVGLLAILETHFEGHCTTTEKNKKNKTEPNCLLGVLCVDWDL